VSRSSTTSSCSPISSVREVRRRAVVAGSASVLLGASVFLAGCSAIPTSLSADRAAGALSAPATVQLSASWEASSNTYGTPAVLTLTTPSDLAAGATVRVEVLPNDTADSVTLAGTSEQGWGSAPYGKGVALTSDQLKAGGTYTVTVAVSGYVRTSIQGSVSSPAHGNPIVSMDYAPTPDLVVGGNTRGTVTRLAGGGGAATTIETSAKGTTGLAVDAAGSLYLADTGSNTVVKVPADGSAPTAVGAGFRQPRAVAVSSSGDVYVADTGLQQVVRIPADGGPQTVIASGLPGAHSIAVSPSGDVYVALERWDVARIAADGSTRMIRGDWDVPTAITVSPAGDLYVADHENYTISKVTAAGAKTAVGHVPAYPSALAVSATGDIFVGTLGDDNIYKIPVTGGASSVVASGMRFPVLAIRPGA
jgi:sugar lactone lactonase YvrE